MQLEQKQRPNIQKKLNELEFFSKAGNGQRLHYEFLKNFNSEETRKAYYGDLKHFFDFYKQAFHITMRHPSEVSRAHIIAYKDFLIECGGKDATKASNLTVRRKLAALSSYFKFMQEKLVVDSNPVEGVKRPKKSPTKGTESLSQEQVKLFLEFMDLESFSHNDNFTVQMHRALIYTLFYSGMRVTEIISLKYQDISKYNGMMIFRVKVKGGSYRMVPVHPTLIDCLKEYLPFLRKTYRRLGQTLSPQSFLFISLNNRKNPDLKHITRHGVYKILNKRAFQAGIRQDISPHSARATLITALLTQGEDLERVSHSVGHANIETTKIYDKRIRSIRDNAILDLNY